MAKLARIITALCVAATVSSSCASTSGLVKTAQAAHVTTFTVHGVVDAEAKVYQAGKIDLAHHELYVDALLKMAQSERTLNDALRTWNQAAGEPMPTAVADAIFSLGVIADDLKPLTGDATVTPLLEALTTAIGTLKGGQ